ncbi:hypothetical protein K458DRAFT_406114 [Lentithecium fluviatile CBS 122367]|uniref:Uncharacterized protein n=1 Tax=Lentithecium fluviatile CBS 122367 TaxID=1168545 RepID=A0A6G1IUI5_9PLEO|nr:hypothetical protein K458DRAFT_406114 [Lentithecium fluviatile CBS 122367]
MSSIFCCSSVQPYKNKRLTEEAKFRPFLTWAEFPKESTVETPGPDISTSIFVIQFVKQVNFGPLEGKRYFVFKDDVFVEVTEQWLIDANFQKLNAFKNFKCSAHNKFFEVNVYQKDPVNTHHWRTDAARPASHIDL